MNPDQKKKRIKQLWAKVRMFVRLRNVTTGLKFDTEKREFQNMIDNQNQDSDASSDEFNSDEDDVDHHTQQVKWYQFNVNSSTI